MLVTALCTACFSRAKINKKLDPPTFRFALLPILNVLAPALDSFLFNSFIIFSGKVAKYLRERQWNDATDLAKRRYELDASLHFAPALVQYYVTLIQNEAPLRAEEIKDELIAVLSGVSKTAKEVEKYANNLRNNERPYEALLFYQLANLGCRQLFASMLRWNFYHCSRSG